jgi:hypothetical protein
MPTNQLNIMSMKQLEVIDYNTVVFEKPKKYGRFWQAVYNYMFKRGMFRYGTEKYICISPNTKQLLKAVGDCILDAQYLYYQKIDRVVMGEDIFLELVDGYTKTGTGPFLFSAGPLYMGQDGKPYTVYDVPVQVIPWIEGIAVIPKENNG